MVIEVLMSEDPVKYEVNRPLDKYHAHEALDRVNTVLIMIEELLSTHPYFQQNEDINESIEHAADHLARAYQLIGQRHL